MKGATVAVLGWWCCSCWGSCTAPLPPRAPPPPSPDVADPERAEVLVDDTMLVFRFSKPPKDLCIYVDWPPLLSLIFSPPAAGTLVAGTLGWLAAGLAVAVGAFRPGLGMPLEAGIALSFFTEAVDVLLPLGMRLAILEPFLEGSTITGSSLGGVLALLLVLFLSSLSLGCGKDLLLWFLQLLVLFGGAKEDAGAFPCCFDIPQGGVGLQVPSSPNSDKSSSSWRDISATEGEVLDADRGLMSRNFSNMERWLPGAVLEESVFGGRRRSEDEGGVGEAVGLGGLVASIDEVALCFMFMDLLRQVFPAVGEGMAEASCCPLVLEGTEPLPFMLPGRGMPFTVSVSEKKTNQQTHPLDWYNYTLEAIQSFSWLRKKTYAYNNNQILA